MPLPKWRDSSGGTVTRMRILVTICAVCAAGFLVAQNTDYRPDPGWQAPAETSKLTNPLTPTPDAVGGGRKLFLRNCAECHGQSGEGKKKHAADLQLPVVQDQSDGALFWKITNGNPVRKMPSFSRLPESQRWQLVLWLRTLKQPAESAPVPHK
jgi:mono/diheme cytochrome c family protein